LVPVDERVLGFANRWYKLGFAAALLATLPTRLKLMHLSAPYFVATKLEAFEDRGNNDVYLSHDLEVIISVVDRREELLEELTGAPSGVRGFIAEHFQAIFNHPDFTYVLPGIVSQSSRTSLVLQRFADVAKL